MTNEAIARLGYSGNSDFAEPVSNEIAECVVCCDEVGNKLACGHAWCTGCVSQSLKHACKDRGLFPPKCCNEHLDTEKLLARVGPALRQEYLVRKETYLKENEVSCSSCGTPIPANAIRRGLADCECGRVTCMFCKKARHDDPFSCVEDGGLRESLTSGGVRVCPGPCSSVIEKHPEGCYNVTYVLEAPANKRMLIFLHSCVKCPTTFCFRCGKTSCSCPGWPEVPTYDEWAKSQEKAGKKPDKTPMQDLWD